MPENPNISSSPNHKPKLRWSLPDSARPTPDLLRRIPELEGIENNPWHVLLTAGRAIALSRWSRTKYVAIVSTVMFLPILLMSAALIWIEPSILTDWKIDRTLFFAGLASYILLLSIGFERNGNVFGGLLHPLSLMYRLAPDPMHDLFLARNNPNEIARAWLHYHCIPSVRFRWVFLLTLLTPLSILFAVRCTWVHRTPISQMLVLSPMLMAGLGWGLLPHCERVILHTIAHLHPRSAQHASNPIADAFIQFRKQAFVFLGVIWQILILSSVSFAFFWLIQKLELVSPYVEMFPGVTVWPFYCYWAMLAAFIFGLAQSIWASKLYKDNLNLLVEKSQAVMRLLLANRIEFDPPVKLPRRSFRESLRWMFRTPVTLLAINKFAKVVNIIACMGLLILVIALVPIRKGVSLWDIFGWEYYEAIAKRGYSIRDVQLVNKWRDFRYVWVDLKGFGDGRRVINVTQTAYTVDWLQDFEHLMSSNCQLDLSLRTPLQDLAEYSRLSSNEKIQKTLSSLEITSPPMNWSEALDFDKLERLTSLRFTDANFTEDIHIPDRIAVLGFEACSNLHRIKFSNNDSDLDYIFVGNTACGELSALFSGNVIHSRTLRSHDLPNCNDVTWLGTQSEIDEIVIWDPIGLKSLSGLENVIGLKRIRVAGYPRIANNPLQDINALALCSELTSISIDNSRLVPAESVRAFTKLEGLEFLSTHDEKILDLPWKGSKYSFLVRVKEEAAFIETKVRWPEAIEKAITNINARREAEHKAAETPMTESAAEATLWPNSSPQTSP